MSIVPYDGYLLIAAANETADALGLIWSVLGGIAGIVGALAGIASVVVAVLIYRWTRALKPQWQLMRTEVTHPTDRDPGQLDYFIELLLENVGGSTAPAAYARVFYPHLGWIEEPHTGRTTVKVGEHLKLASSFRLMVDDVPVGWPGRRNYMRGDDVFFDLRGVVVEMYWGPGGKFRQVITDIHAQQLTAPVLDRAQRDN